MINFIHSDRSNDTTAICRCVLFNYYNNHGIYKYNKENGLFNTMQSPNLMDMTTYNIPHWLQIGIFHK